MTGGWSASVRKIITMRERRVAVEEIYYISINPIRIENCMHVPTTHVHPFLRMGYSFSFTTLSNPNDSASI